MDIKELIDDYKEVCREEGYSECRFMYCERDEIAAEEEFDKFIPLAKKYNIGFSDLLEEDEDEEYHLDWWEKGDYFGYRVRKGILKKIKEINPELGELL